MEAGDCCEISVRLYHNALRLAPEDGIAGGQRGSDTCTESEGSGMFCEAFTGFYS